MDSQLEAERMKFAFFFPSGVGLTYRVGLIQAKRPQLSSFGFFSVWFLCRPLLSHTVADKRPLFSTSAAVFFLAHSGKKVVCFLPCRFSFPFYAGGCVRFALCVRELGELVVVQADFFLFQNLFEKTTVYPGWRGTAVPAC